MSQGQINQANGRLKAGKIGVTIAAITQLFTKLYRIRVDNSPAFCIKKSRKAGTFAERWRVWG